MGMDVEAGYTEYNTVRHNSQTAEEEMPVQAQRVDWGGATVS